MTKPPILHRIPPLMEPSRRRLEAACAVHYATDEPLLQEVLAEHGERIRGMLMFGSHELTAPLLDAMPRLEIVACRSAGYDRIDIQLARERGLIVTHNPGMTASCVADHAMALLLAAMRAIPAHDRAMRAGLWREGELLSRPAPNGRRLGLLGLGEIGRRIARRAEGFEMEVLYHSRQQYPDVPYRHVGSLVELARLADCLVVAAPGGPKTRHMVNAEVLAALGPEGFLVNIGRGSVVDTAALITALREGHIAGAGLDVFESEPEIEPALRALPNVVMTPHIAGKSPEATSRAEAAVVDTLLTHFAGQIPANVIPELRGG